MEVCVKDWNYPSLSNCCLNCIIYLWHLGFFFIIAQHWCILYPWSLVKLVHVLLLLFGSSKILDVQIKIGLLSTDLKNKDSFYVIVLIRYFFARFSGKNMFIALSPALFGDMYWLVMWRKHVSRHYNAQNCFPYSIYLACPLSTTFVAVSISHSSPPELQGHLYSRIEGILNQVKSHSLPKRR